MKLIIGLGNPGKEYEQTRHNLGFLALDKLSDRLDMVLKFKNSLEADIAEGIFENEKIILAKPQTFMNASGRSVYKLVQKFKATASDLVIIYDDADLEFGQIRFKKTGSSGGHNGMQSILDVFGKKAEISRLRIGIGRGGKEEELEHYVLQKFSSQEKNELIEILDQALDTLIEEIKK